MLSTCAKSYDLSNCAVRPESSGVEQSELTWRFEQRVTASAIRFLYLLNMYQFFFIFLYEKSEKSFKRICEKRISFLEKLKKQNYIVHSTWNDCVVFIFLYFF